MYDRDFEVYMQSFEAFRSRCEEWIDDRDVMIAVENNFLCKVKSFGDKNLTQDEIEDFHLSTLKMTYEEAISEYEKRRETKLGRLIANRELPVLLRAKEIMGGKDF